MKRFILLFIISIGTYNLSNAQGYDIALMAGESDPRLDDVKTKLLATGVFNAIDVYRADTLTPSTATMQNYDAILVWVAFGINDPTAFGNNLAAYVDAGGGVVTAHAAFLSGGTIDGSFGTNYRLINPSTTQYPLTSGNMGVTYLASDHPIINEYEGFDGGAVCRHVTGATIATGATIVANWDDGSPFAVYKENVGPSLARRVDLNFYPVSSDDVSSGWVSEGDTYMANALAWVAGGFCFTEVLTNYAGTFTDGSGILNYSNNQNCSWLIQPPGATSITLTFTAFNTEPGFDFVYVYDGSNSSAPLLASLSGATLPTQIASSGGSLYIEFYTDGSVSNPGWSINYTSDFVLPTVNQLVGDWVMVPEADAFYVGPTPGSSEWWSNSAEDVTIRACYFDDVYTFGAGGAFSIEMDNETWLEPWQGVEVEGCGVPIAPHDGSGSYTYSISGNSLTLSGTGAFLGLPKAVNGAELPNVSVPSSVTYDIVQFDDQNSPKTITVQIEVGTDIYWTFRLQSSETSGSNELIAHWPLGLSIGGADQSGLNQDLVFNNNSILADRFKNNNESIGFNGTDTYLNRTSLNHPTGDASFSYSFWEYHATEGDVRATSIYLGDGGEGDFEIRIDHFSDNIEVFGLGSQIFSDNSISAAAPNRWNHIAVIKNGNGLKIYVNGILAGDGSGFSTDIVSTDIYVGNNVDFNTPFTGRMDDIRIYNNAIDETEVLSLFNEGVNTSVPIAWLEPSSATPNDEVTIYYNAERGNKALMGADRAYIHVGAVVGNDPIYEWGDYVLDTIWFSGIADNGIGEMTLTSGNTWQYTLSPSAREALEVPVGDLMQRLGMVFRSPNATVFGVGTPSEYGDFPGGRVEDGTYWSPGDIYLDLTNLSSPGVLQLDSLALVALYNSTNGSSWFDNSNWLSGPVGTWYGVTVANDRVTEVDLYDNNLIGSIPPDIGNLSAIVNLYLALNDFTGSTIPAEINQLTSMVELNLYSTGIGGDIPDLSALTNLTLLSLSDNELTGTIPTTIGSLTNLTDLYLWGNNLTGTIPSSLGNLVNLDWLAMSTNNLTGTIPSTMGNLSQLTYLSLTNNDLSGQIPSSFSNLTSLDVLALGGNNFSGQIPSYLGVNVFLRELYLWGNDFTGKIPTSLGNMTGLTELWLSNNFLIGPIPAEFNNLIELNSLILGGNQLSDTIPDLSNLDSLVDFSVFENNLSGDVPDYFNQFPLLEVFSVRDNNFENMVDLSGLGNLTDVRMEGNRFTFEDILPNIGIALNGEIYSPQQKAGKEKFVKVSLGSDYTINLGFDLAVGGNSYDWYRDGSFNQTTTVPILTISNFQAAQTWYAEITNSSAPDLILTTSNINLEISNLCASSANDDFDTRIDRVIFADLDYTSSVVGDGLCASYSNFTDQSATVAVGQTVDIGFQIGTCGSLYDRGVKMYVDWDQDGSFDESTEFVGQGGILSDADPDGFLFFTEDFYTIPQVANGNYTLRVVAQETSDISTITGCGTYEYGETEDYTIQVIDTQSDLIVNADDISPESMFNSSTPLSSTDQITITMSVTNIGQYASIGSTNGVGIYASDDDIWDTGDVLIEMVAINSIDAASSVTLSTITIDPPAIEGSFYGIVVVNPLEEIPETDYDNNAIVSDPIYVSAPADSENPVVTLVSPPSTYTKGTGGVTIAATVTDNMGIEGVVLAYGKRSEITDDFDQSQYTVIFPEEVSAGRYEHLLADSDFDEVGVQYYFGATDNAGNVGLSSPLPAKISVEFPDGSINLSDVSPVSNASDPQETDYRIFSVPVLNATINSVLGFTGADRTAWRVWQFNGNSNSELSSTSSGLSVGRGYWLIYLNSAGIDLNFGGQAVDASNSSPYIMNLSSGINLIGNPYNFPISWQEVITHNIDEGIINDGDVSGLTFYRGGFNSAGNGTLGVTEGAFVQSNEPVALQIPPSTSTLARTGNNMRTYPKALDDESWEVGINLSNAVTFYNVASIGMNPEASDGNDKYDQQAMPYLFNYLEFNSNNDQLTDRISQEIVETTDSHVWEYEATTSFEPSAAILSWDNSYFGDNDRQLYLYDVAEERIINMREQQEYHFDLKGKRRFRIAYGSQEFIESNLQPNRFTLGHAYPNPFADVTRIPFSLSNESSEYKVKMTIYNSVGELVEVLTDESYQPGFYAADWDGTNTLGQQVSEGIYIYKLSITHEEGSENLTGKLIYGR